MTIKGELASLASPMQPELSQIPDKGDRVPATEQLVVPRGKNVIVTFLRHCGCPYAEKTFRDLRRLAAAYSDISCIAVSHSSKVDTDVWLASLPRDDLENSLPPNLTIYIDDERAVYAKWGLGLSSYWATLGPSSLFNAVKLGLREGIKNRPTGSGYRLQKAGSFAVDQDGIVRWVHVASGADDMSDLREAIKSLEQ